MIRKIARYYPFTLPGTVIFGLLMYLIGAGYTQKNPYALFLSFAGIAVLTVLITLSRIQAYRMGKEQLHWDASAALYSSRRGQTQRFYTGGFKSWFFFRVHVRITGRLKIDGRAIYRVIQEGAFTGDNVLELPLWFQCSGMFAGKGVFIIKDVFGLVRAGAGEPLRHILPVQPSLFIDESPMRLQISGGEDDSKPRKSSDQEKYYQREYVPGDRFRDINWKATSRIGDIFTRISPVTEEQTKLVLVDFRHFSGDIRYAPVHGAHLEALKRWCISFLWKTKTSQPEYQFIVYTGLGALYIEEAKDIKALSIGLSSVFYGKDPRLVKDLTGIGEVYVLTTPFDRELGSALHAYSGRRVTLFKTAGLRSAGEENGDNIFTFSVMKNNGLLHIPGGWAFRGREGRNDGRGRAAAGAAGLSRQTVHRYVETRLI